MSRLKDALKRSNDLHRMPGTPSFRHTAFDAACEEARDQIENADWNDHGVPDSSQTATTEHGGFLGFGKRVETHTTKIPGRPPAYDEVKAAQKAKIGAYTGLEEARMALEQKSGRHQVGMGELANLFQKGANENLQLIADGETLTNALVAQRAAFGIEAETVCIEAKIEQAVAEEKLVDAISTLEEKKHKLEVQRQQHAVQLARGVTSKGVRSPDRAAEPTIRHRGPDELRQIARGAATAARSGSVVPGNSPNSLVYPYAGCAYLTTLLEKRTPAEADNYAYTQTLDLLQLADDDRALVTRETAMSDLLRYNELHDQAENLGLIGELKDVMGGYSKEKEGTIHAFTAHE